MNEKKDEDENVCPECKGKFGFHNPWCSLK
jgi:hypothetical protein